MKILMPKYLQNGGAQGRSRGVRSFVIHLTLLLFALVANQTKGELGGQLYYGGAHDKDSDGYPHLAWDPKEPKGAYGLSVISSQPHALWLGNWTGGADKRAATNYVYGALSSNQIPVLVLYNLPFRDCGQASKGGAKDSIEYQKWVRDIADGIEDAMKKVGNLRGAKVDQSLPILVMLEPDSIGLIPTDDYNDPTNGKKCWVLKGGPKGPLVPMFDYETRWGDLHYATWTLASTTTGYGCNLMSDGMGGFYRPSSCTSFNSRVKVYLDGGNSGWQSAWPDVMAQRMASAGIGMAQGFFTNSSNYQKTADEIAYGFNLQNSIKTAIATEIYDCGGKFCPPPQKTQIIDVSRNGNGPGSFSKTADGSPYQANGWPYWCDNQQARLGQHATLYANKYVAELSQKGALSFIDGLLWIKPPGETDGCWGGPSTRPNVQPDESTLLTDVFWNGSWNKPADAAGWASPSLACGLATGKFIHPAYSKESTAFCDFAVSAQPAAPTNFRIINETRKANGATADTVTLEWEPVPGACEYHIAARVNASKVDNESLVKTVVFYEGKSNVGLNINSAWKGFGPRTTYLVNPATKGNSVVYSIKSVSCDGKKSSAWTVTPKTVTFGWK